MKYEVNSATTFEVGLGSCEIRMAELKESLQGKSLDEYENILFGIVLDRDDGIYWYEHEYQSLDDAVNSINWEAEVWSFSTPTGRMYHIGCPIYAETLLNEDDWNERVDYGYIGGMFSKTDLEELQNYLFS